MCDMTHSYVCHDVILRDMPHSYAWRNSFLCVGTHSYVWHDPSIYVPWRIPAWHASIIRATWLISMCRHSFICVTGPIHMCDVDHPLFWHDSWHYSIIRVTCPINMCAMTYSCMTRLIQMCDVTYFYVSGLIHTTNGGDRTWNNYDCQNFQQVFTEVPVHIKQLFTGVPQISNEFSREFMVSPSLKRSIRETDRSGHPNILSPISSMSWVWRGTCTLKNIVDCFCPLAWIPRQVAGPLFVTVSWVLGNSVKF